MNSLHLLASFRRSRVFILSGLVLALLAGASGGIETDKHVFGVRGKSILCVPESDLNRNLISFNNESISLKVGSGNTPGFSFLFDAKRLQKHLKPNVFRVRPELDALPHVNTLGGTVGFMSEEDSRRLGPAMRARDLADEWYSTGICHKASFVRVDSISLFEIKCRSDDRYYNILNRAPERNTVLPDPNSIVVAACLDEDISVGEFSGTSLQSCRRTVVIDGFLVDYQLQKHNVPLFLQIDQFLARMISEWRRSCNR